MAQRFTAARADFYRQFLKGLPRGMAVLHLKQSRRETGWELVARNVKAVLIAGDTVDGYLNLPISEFYARETPSRVEEIYREVLATHTSRILGHVRHVAPPAAAAMLVASAHPLDANCVAIDFEDVSALNKTTLLLLEAESLLGQICDSTRAIVWRAEPVTLQFTSVSKEAREILGYWIERWLGESDFFRKHVHADDWNLVRERCELAAGEGGKQQFDCRMLQADGEARWFHIYVKKITLPSGRDELAGVMVDITDRKRAEDSARNISARVIRVQEDERRRISRDLHDSLGQYLTGLKCSLGAIMRDPDCNNQLRQKLKDCGETLRICMDETRSISQMLHPPVLDLLGLAPTLRSYAEGFSRRAGIRVEVHVPETDARLDATQENALFRIAQECLTNVQRHSKSSSATLRLAYGPRDVVLEIADDGVGVKSDLLDGLAQGKNGRGIGMLRMRERVHELKGKFEIRSEGHGMTVRVEIPRYAPPVEIHGAAKTLTAASSRGSS